MKCLISKKDSDKVLFFIESQDIENSQESDDLNIIIS